jgi:prepilin peptidase CpaA
VSTYHLLMAAPALALMVWAAAEDLRSRRIPNWLTFSLILSGLVQSVLPGSVVSPGHALLGMLLGFTLMLFLFLLGAMGGGDVKLLSGVGAWFGVGVVWNVFLLAAVIGAVMVIAQALSQRRTKMLLRNTAVVAINLAHVNDVGLEHTKATGQSCRSVDRPLPYALPILIAMLALLAMSWR